MKKLIIVLFIMSIQSSFYAQTSEKAINDKRNDVERLKSENQAIKKKVSHSHYKINITKYGKNLVEYDRVYENYYHFNHVYLVEDSFISYFHEKGQSAKILAAGAPRTGSYGALYETEYYFVDKNSGYKYEKKVSLYRGDNLVEKQKELDALEYTITPATTSDYEDIYSFYNSDVKK